MEDLQKTEQTDKHSKKDEDKTHRTTWKNKQQSLQLRELDTFYQLYDKDITEVSSSKILG